jgi:hypothetical protein
MTERDRESEADAAANGQLKTPVQARQGVKTHRVRWILALSLSLGVLAIGGAWIWGASTHPHDSAAAASHQPTG